MIDLEHAISGTGSYNPGQLLGGSSAAQFAPAAGTAIGSFFGPVGAAVGGALGTAVFNAQQARQQMDFQERMRDTAFQARAQDLMAAGINPILATQTGAAAVPSGAMGTVGQSDMAGAFNARTAMRQQQAMLQSQADKASWDADAAKWDAFGAQSDAMLRRREYLIASPLSDDEQEARRREIAARVADATTARRVSELDFSLYGPQDGPGLRTIEKYVGPGASAASSAASLFRSFGGFGAGLRPYSRQVPGPAYLR